MSSRKRFEFKFLHRQFCFGCDGSGAEELIVKGSGARNNIEKNKQKLFMNGPAILLFTLNQVPKLLSETLKKIV